MMSEIDDLKTMFKSGNDVPVTRVTITLEQFERICEMFKNQHDSGLAVIKENQQLRFDNTELVQDRDRLLEFARHLSTSGCHCQISGQDVDENRHLNFCMVGKAQKHLGIKVTEKHSQNCQCGPCRVKRESRKYCR